MAYNIKDIDFDLKSGKATLTLEDGSTKELSLDSIHYNTDIAMSLFKVDDTKASLSFAGVINGEEETEVVGNDVYHILELSAPTGGEGEQAYLLGGLIRISWRPGQLIGRMFSGSKEYKDVEKVWYYANQHKATIYTSEGMKDLDNINGVELEHPALGYPTLGKDTLLQAGLGTQAVARLIPPSGSKFDVKVQGNILEVEIPYQAG